MLENVVFLRMTLFKPLNNHGGLCEVVVSRVSLAFGGIFRMA